MVGINVEQEMGRGSDKEDRGSFVDCRREASSAEV